jgi:type IV pilus assembly protein PilA
MMVVVTIIGVLATLAVVGYRAIVQSSHVSEATDMVQNIRAAQEGYHSETQQYANITPTANFPTGTSQATNLYPGASSGGGGTPVYGKVTAWGKACTVCVAGYDWSVLPIHVDGPVQFGYATVGGAAGDATNFINAVTVNGVGLPLTQPATDFYEIGAEADLDGNTANWTDVYGFSWTNQLFVSNEGL